jgi:hypothetical protein
MLLTGIGVVPKQKVNLSTSTISYCATRNAFGKQNRQGHAKRSFARIPSALANPGEDCFDNVVVGRGFGGGGDAELLHLLGSFCAD